MSQLDVIRKGLVEDGPIDDEMRPGLKRYAEGIHAAHDACDKAEWLMARLAAALEMAAGSYAPPTDEQRNAWLRLVQEVREWTSDEWAAKAKEFV